MIRKTVLSLGILLGLSVHSKVKNILLIVSDDLKADALGCYGSEIAQTPTPTNWPGKARSLKTPIVKGRSAVLPGQVSCEDATDGKGNYLGRTFSKKRLFKHPGGQDLSHARTGRHHRRNRWRRRAGMLVGQIQHAWKEAHTPGNYACLNLQRIHNRTQGRQSTKMPFRMFVTVDYVGDGSDQPDWKAATKSVELSKLSKKREALLLATGLVRPTTRTPPRQYFERYPFEQMKLPFVPKGDWDDMPKAAISNSNSQKYGIDKFPDNQKRMWSGYLATVTFMDEQVGRILKALEELGLEKETAVFFTSDHGYLLGEHHFGKRETSGKK